MRNVTEHSSLPFVGWQTLCLWSLGLPWVTSLHNHKSLRYGPSHQYLPRSWAIGLLTLFCGCLLSSLLPLSFPLAFVWLRKWKAHTGSAGPHLLEVLSLFFLWMLQQMAHCRFMQVAAHLWARAQSAAGHVVLSYSHPQLGFTSWTTERQRGLGYLTNLLFFFFL